MIISPEDKEERRKAIAALISRWVKSKDTSQKAALILEKQQQQKIAGKHWTVNK